MDTDKQQLERMPQRPKSVTIFSWWIIISSVFILVWMFGAAAITGSISGDMKEISFIAVAGVYVIQAVLCVFMLKGQDWARVLVLWLQGITIIIDIIEIYIGFKFGRMSPSMVIRTVLRINFYIILVIYLTGPASSEYFFSQSMLNLFLWLRYLRKKKIVLLSIAAVALSVSLLIVVASLFTGFINTFKNTAVEAIGDVVITPHKSFSKYDRLIEDLQQIEMIEAATAKITGYGLLHLDMGNVRAVEIWGIEPGRRSKVTGFDNFLIVQKNSGSKATFNVPDSPEEISGFVGIGVINKPDEQTDEYDLEAAKKMLGEEITLTTGITSGADNATLTEIKRKVLNFTIRDIVETGVYQFDTACIYLSIEQLSKTLYPDEELPVADQINIKLAENTDSEVALAVIRGIWRNFVEEQLEADPYLITANIETAQEMQSRFIAAYLQQMNVLLVIFGIVSFGVVLLVFCIFYLIVRLKQKDIAIVKSCGAASSSVAGIFIGFGACVGVIGSGIGVVLGYVITTNINIIEQWIRVIFGLKLWRSSVYMFSRIPDEVNWPWALCIVLLAIIAAIIGSLIPAVIAAITKPVKILRYE